MKRLIAAAGAVALLAVLTGCSGAYQESQKTEEQKLEDNGYSLYESTIRLSDGRTITCIVHSRSNQGGLSCDWNPEKDVK